MGTLKNAFDAARTGQQNHRAHDPFLQQHKREMMIRQILDREADPNKRDAVRVREDIRDAKIPAQPRITTTKKDEGKPARRPNLFGRMFAAVAGAPKFLRVIPLLATVFTLVNQNRSMRDLRGRILLDEARREDCNNAQANELIHMGASLSIHDKKGRDALTHAAINGNAVLVELLATRVSDKSLQKAIIAAEKHDHRDIAEHLREIRAAAQKVDAYLAGKAGDRKFEELEARENAARESLKAERAQLEADKKRLEVEKQKVRVAAGNGKTRIAPQPRARVETEAGMGDHVLQPNERSNTRSSVHKPM